MNTNNHRNGLTVIESLLAISIIVILGGIGFASLIASRNIRDLTTSSQNTLSILRLAQSRTLAGENDSSWGVRLESNQITLFQGDTFAGSPLIRVYPLPNSIQITNIVLNGGGSDVIFKRVTGQTDQAGAFLLSVINAPSNSFPVTVHSLGKVYQTTAFLPPSIVRTIDTRHRSFALNWSIKNATVLRLTFADPPNPNTVTDIAMSSFFDAGKTKFDWSGTIPIGALDQTLRIHTTTLTDSNTVLSVDRDCRRNTKKLTIEIVDILVKAIATYEADCATVSVGAFGGTVSEP